MIRFYILVLILYSEFCIANDISHRNEIIKVSLQSNINKIHGNRYFFSDLSYITKTPRYLNDASGQFIASRPRIVRSIYDDTIEYDVTEKYDLLKARLSFKANYISNQIIYTIGFDSGVITPKLQVNKSFMIGMTIFKQSSNRSLFIFGFGGWLGGKISESPCYDSYDREYWCQNLVAWSDYKPNYPLKNRYLDIKYLRFF